MDKLCEYCNKPIINARSNQKFHIECSAPALRDRRRRLNYTGEKVRPLLYCSRCGIHIEVPIGTQRYCTSCFMKEKAEILKKANLQNEEKSDIEAAPNIKKRPFLSLAEVDRLAKAEGLSYGQYSVKHGLYASLYNTDCIKKSSRPHHLSRHGQQ